MVAAAFGATGLLAAAPALAHPLGNFTVNRYSGIELMPGHVRVTYALDLAEIPTFQEMPAIDANGDERADATERRSWADRTAPELLRGIVLSVGGWPVALGSSRRRWSCCPDRAVHRSCTCASRSSATSPTAGASVRRRQRRRPDRVEGGHAQRDGVALRLERAGGLR
jgi:hypothetical protein